MNYQGVVAGGIFVILLLASGGVKAANSDCLECHDSQETMLSFFHGANEVQCTDCHGPSKEHLDRPRTPPSIVFTDDGEGDVLNGTCLACHDNGGRVHWESGAHGDANVACSGCHDIHVHKDRVLGDRTQMEVCTGCHRDVQVQLNYPSRHPVKEGKTECSSCHAPHGSTTESLLKKASVTDTCTSCHREKRGPFLFEHDPVTENCDLCHKPHGSVLPSLLVARPPFLCQQCHLAAGHPSRLPDGSRLAVNDQILMAKGCVNCHSQVHGSNHPSGARLTR